MKIINNIYIDLSQDLDSLKINVSNGSSLVVQTDGLDGALVMKGRNTSSENGITLYAISNSFVTVSSLSSDGIYTFDVSGIDVVEVEYSGDEGKAYIKVVD